MTTLVAPDCRPVDLTARQWRERVTSFARHRGWLTHYAEANVVMATGFPGVTCVRSLPGGDRRIVFAMLATSRGKLTGLQREWLGGLHEVALMSRGHVEIHVWRPQDWPLVRKVLL